MSSKGHAEVRTYHHGNLRAALVEQAITLGREKGPEGVVLREVARRTGVSHNAAYRHFAHREELLREVSLVGLKELGGLMAARMKRVRVTDPEERARRRLRETGKAYVQYALSEPGLFAIAFTNVHMGDLVGPYLLLGAVLDECVESGWMPAAKRPSAELICWAGVHGFSMLYAPGLPMGDVSKKQRDSDLDKLLDRIDDSLG